MEVSPSAEAYWDRQTLSSFAGEPFRQRVLSKGPVPYLSRTQPQEKMVFGINNIFGGVDNKFIGPNSF
jgi:hypothetical protein